MIVDLNRPPLPLPLRDPDGIVKTETIDGKKVFVPGKEPDMACIHRLLMQHYFPYHQRIDELLDRFPVRVALDCHSMLPSGSKNQKDAGRQRPLICLGNNGDHAGRAKAGSLATCSSEWISVLAELFREEFPGEDTVAINHPFSGGFISNAHYWHKGIPWIQIEVNRRLYESSQPGSSGETDNGRVLLVRELIWRVLVRFWNIIALEPSVLI
jgi:formiminoglutamase